MILFEATATHVLMNDGAFHTDYRYLRERSTATAFNLVSGATAAMHTAAPSGSSDVYIVWRYVSGSYAIQMEVPPLSISHPTVTQTVVQVDG